MKRSHRPPPLPTGCEYPDNNLFFVDSMFHLRVPYVPLKEMAVGVCSGSCCYRTRLFERTVSCWGYGWFKWRRTKAIAHPHEPYTSAAAVPYMPISDKVDYGIYQ